MLTIGYTLISVERSQSKGKGKGILIGDKLRALLENTQISDRELARRIGVSPTAVYKWKTNKSGITWEQLQVLSKTLDVPIDYFLGDEEKATALGVPESYFIEDDPPKQYPPTPDVVEREYIAIPIITGVGAGGEVITDDYTLIRRAQLPRRVLSAFEVEGDSMEPTIPKGYLVLIDPDDKELVDGKVYLFASGRGTTESGLTIRRVFKQNDEWVMVPDNRTYAPSTLNDDWVVVGRVVKKIPKMEPEDVE